MEIDAIQKLIETDEKTRARIDAQYQKRFELKQAVEDEKKRLSDEAWQAVRSQVDTTRAELDAKIAADEKTNREYYDRASAALTKMYEENKDQWKKEIVSRILEVDGE